jgi:competence protein ComEC
MVQGRVYRKENRLVFGERQTLVYLKQVVVLLEGKNKDSVDTKDGENEQRAMVSDLAYEPESHTDYSYGLICEVKGEVILPLGAVVQLSGRYDVFSVARNPGEFDEEQYYGIQGLVGRLKNADLVHVVTEPKNKLPELLYRIREEAKNKIYSAFPSAEASVMTAMLLGDTKDLDTQVKELYKRNGIIHILSISGLHISLMGLGLYKFLRKMRVPDPYAAIAGTILLLLYGTLTGWGISVQRAVGMYLIRMFGKCIGRTYDMLTALGVMGVWILLRNPAYLLHTGFLLSFGSVMGIGLLQPVLAGRWGKAQEELEQQESVQGAKPELGCGSESGQKAEPRNWTKLRKGAKARKGTVLLFGREYNRLMFVRNKKQTQELLRKKKWKEAAAILTHQKKSRLAKDILYEFAAISKDSAMVGLSVTLFTLPIQLRFYYGIATYSLALNLLILPPMAILMAAGSIAMLLPAWQLPIWIACKILAFYELTCTFFQNLPFSYWLPGMPKTWQIIAYYVMLGMLLLGWHIRKSRAAFDKVITNASSDYYKVHTSTLTGKAMGYLPIPYGRILAGRIHVLRKLTGVIWMCSAIILLGWRQPEGLQIDFLDVGQGDSICIRTENGSAYLIDGGSTSESGLGQYTLIPYLRSQGISTLDAVFITHADEDHYSGILELLTMGADNGIRIRRLILPDIDVADRDQEWSVVFEALNASKEVIPVSYIHADTSWQEQELTFTCLHPPLGYQTQESNCYSLCLLVEQSDFSLLLTGDVEGEGERMLQQALTKHGLNHLTILKAAHHGSGNSTTEGFLDQTNPDIAVISCGEDNPYGHPHPDLLERLRQGDVKTLMTPYTGTIRFRLIDGKLTLKTYTGRT